MAATPGNYNLIFTNAVAANQAVALCRLPSQSQVQVIVGSAPSHLKPVPPASALPAFVFAPFASSNLAFLVEADILSATFPLLYADNDPVHAWHHAGTHAQHFDTEEDFIRLVEEYRRVISAGSFKKLVATRCAPVSLRTGFDPVRLFTTLCKLYPDAFVYIFSSAQTGTWIGATPEKLISKEGNTLTTVALAATMPAGSTETWKEKEVEEHFYVEEFIQQVLVKNQVHNFQKSTPQTIRAGNLVHLCSTFSIANATNEQFISLLRDLNPTPAVCGMPQEDALRFIREKETFDRRFYTGFTGIVTGSAVSLFVNLRCMELLAQTGLLYAGAGITADSVPEKEWTETVLKMESISRHL